MPTGWAACSQVVRDDAAVIVDDTHADPYHFDSLAVAESGIRSYAGVPLRDVEGRVVGTLCVMDPRPGRFTRNDVRTLTVLARQGNQLLFRSS
ncbi:GAF domain-containing protein [Actinoplanes sp. NPDC051346]|uniref:GAF domain-containing protein n=1 Tax=Actinoplanes sp. NPDC051346 TaxID=3155048 RepID=UPI003419E74F